MVTSSPTWNVVLSTDSLPVVGPTDTAPLDPPHVSPIIRATESLGRPGAETSLAVNAFDRTVPHLRPDRTGPDRTTPSRIERPRGRYPGNRYLLFIPSWSRNNWFCTFVFFFFNNKTSKPLTRFFIRVFRSSPEPCNNLEMVLLANRKRKNQGGWAKSGRNRDKWVELKGTSKDRTTRIVPDKRGWFQKGWCTIRWSWLWDLKDIFM